MAERAWESLRHDMEHMPAVTLAAVEKIQAEIAHIAGKMHAEGKIIVPSLKEK